MKNKRKQKDGPADADAGAPSTSKGGAIQLNNEPSGDTDAFPRGHGKRASRLSALEMKEINQQASRAVAMETIFPEAQDGDMDVDSAEAKEGSKRKRPKLASEATKVEVPGDSITEVPAKKKVKRNRNASAAKVASDAKDVEKKEPLLLSVSYKRLNVGMRFMGVVREVNDLDAVVALPNQLTGFVSLTELSSKLTSVVEEMANDEDDDDDDLNDNVPSLSKYLAVGQLVICTIMALEASGGDEDVSRRKIELSLRPNFVNRGLNPKDLSVGTVLMASVVSVEDHGYVMDLGLDQVQGFLNKKQSRPFQQKFFEERDLVEGQTIACYVQKAGRDGRVIPLALYEGGAKQTALTNDNILPFESVTPGMLVTGKVKAVKANGVHLTFLGTFMGGMSFAHSPLVGMDSTTKALKEGQTITSRILYVDPETKAVGLTCRKPFIEWDVTRPDVPYGHIWQTVEVIHAEEKLGIFVRCPDGSTGYIHISKISDGKILSVDTEVYSVGSTHKARVVGYDFSDGVYLLSMKPSVLNAPFLRKEDIPVAAVLKGTVARVETHGVHVTLAENISGLVPISHLSEFRVANPNKMFRSGMTLKCKVLANNLASKKITLTLKKNLLNSTLQPVDSYDRSHVGVVTHGYIVSIKEFGCIVGFYNDVRAIAPLPELSLVLFLNFVLTKVSDRFVRSAAELYRVGEVVKCRVMSTDPNLSRMLVSMKLSGPEDTVNLDKVSIAQIVSGKVLSLLPDAALIELSPSLVRAMLPKSQISDHLDSIEPLWNALSEGMELSELLAIEKDTKKGRVVVSMKPSLISYSREKGASIGYEAGTILPGYVKSLTESKLFVTFVNGQIGVAKLNNVADSFVSKLSELFVPGQSVQCKILTWNETKSNYDISLKHSQIYQSEPGKGLDHVFIESFFRERDVAAQWAANDLKKLRAWSLKYSIGATVSGSVQQKTPYGFIVGLKDKDASGLVTNELAGAMAASEVGTPITGHVVDVDPAKKIVDFKASDATSDDKATAKRSKHWKKMLEFVKSGEKTDGAVEMVKTSYIVISLPSFGSQLAFAPIRTFNNAGASSFPKLYRVGQRVKVVLTFVPESHNNKGNTLTTRVLAALAQSSEPKEASLQTSQAKRLIKDPVDASVSSLEELTLGRVIQGRVRAIKETQVNVALGSNLNGRLHITEVASLLKDLPDRKAPFKNLKVGTVASFAVVGFHENGKSHKFLPFSHRNPTARTVVELSLRAIKGGDELSDISARSKTLEEIEVGSEHMGFVSKATNDHVWVCLNPFLLGRVHVLECSDDIEVLKDVPKHFPIGSAVMCKVLTKNLDKGELNLSLRKKPQQSIVNTLSTKERLIGRVVKQNDNKTYTIQIGDHLFGRAWPADVSEEIKDLSKDSLVYCYVVGKTDSGAILLYVGEKKPAELDLKTDATVKGVVKNISDGGLFLDLGRGVTARVQIKNVSEKYVKDWKNLYKVGDRVTGKIVSYDATNNRVEVTLKGDGNTKASKAGSGSKLGLDGLKKGMKVKGTIKAIADYGLFIRINDSEISGLCHKSEVSDVAFTSLSALYEVGDPVKAIILKVDKAKQKVSFGLKASYFDEDDVSDDDENQPNGGFASNWGGDDGDDDEEEDEEDGEAKADMMDEDDEDNEGENGEEEEEDGDAAEVDAEEGEEDDEELAVEEDDAELDAMEVDEDTRSSKKSKPRESSKAFELLQNMEPLKLFDDEEEEKDDDDEDEMDEGDEETKKGLSRRQKKRAKEEAEEKIREKEEALLDAGAPESAEAFDRLLLSSPNSSFMWVKYMAFHIEMSNIAKARDVAEKALKTIAYREGNELLNVWVAYLNLENSFGDSDSLGKVFNRAVIYNDAKKVFLHMANIYERTKKYQELDSHFEAMVKRFKESCKVWVAYGTSLMKRGKLDEARAVLSRSLKSIAKRKHLKAISKFAQLEFKLGVAERGRTLFEGIVANYPKRLDLWNVYLDMEIKNGDVPLVRNLFQRAITIKQSSKKMKFLFKKWLQFEQTAGTEEGAELVKEKAIAYVEQITSSKDE
ncbi:hypothetical protein HDU96_009589 [Phlyctochytrium bullatum]|nr:hypothetical protein HDU96_009589 [Phlyctochytrium bullatum]